MPADDDSYRTSIIKLNNVVLVKYSKFQHEDKTQAHKHTLHYTYPNLSSQYLTTD